MLYHRHYNLLSGRIAVTEHQENTGVLLCTVGKGTRDTDLIDSAACLNLLSQELTIAVDKLRTVVVGQTIGHNTTLEKVIEITLDKVLVITFSSQRSKFLPCGTATGSPLSQRHQQYQIYQLTHYFWRTNTFIGLPVRVQCSRILFSRKRL